MPTSLTNIRRNLYFLGVGRTTVRSIYMAANSIATLRIYDCMTLAPGDVRAAALPQGAPFAGRFLEPEEMRRLGRDPENNFPVGHLNRALAENDDCYALFRGDVLASFGWYSSEPTPVLTRILQFDPSWMYMYHGYTKSVYRGQRLHALGLAHAVERYAADGKRGLIAIAEVVNYASRRSAHRLGFETVAWIAHLGVGRLDGAWHSTTCADYGLRLENPDICDLSVSSSCGPR